jgi:hypothetical protein
LSGAFRMTSQLEPLLFVASMRLRPLLGSSSEEPENKAGGDRIIVLMKIGTERGPVVVRIEQTDVEAPGGVEIQSTARFNRKTISRSRVTTGPADGGIRARSSEQSFHKRGCAPAISSTAEEAGPKVISIEYILGAVGRYEAVAAVRDDLQPWFYTPAKRPHGTIQVARGSATDQACKRVATKELHQRSVASAREGPLPACSRFRGPDSGWWRLSRCGLRLRGYKRSRLHGGWSRFRWIRCGCGRCAFACRGRLSRCGLRLRECRRSRLHDGRSRFRDT